MWDFLVFYTSISKNCDENNMQRLNSGFNKLKVDD
jgi:hypothetical protein